MTREEILALEGRELDRAVAERVMGYECVDTEWGMRYWKGTAKRHSYRSHEMDYEPVELYYRDANAARLVLAEVERRGKVREFLDALWDVLYLHPELSFTDKTWAHVTATPTQICRAALLAMTE